MNAITFIVHGARSPSANRFIKRMISEAACGKKNVNVGFLEFAQPQLASAVQAHIRRGAKRIRLIPLLLATGKHLKKDVPALLKPVKKANPAVIIEIAPCLGAQKEFQKLIKKMCST